MKMFSKKILRLIPLGILFLILLFVTIRSSKGSCEMINSPEKHGKENCSNWISENYVKCIQHQLPCECEKETDSYFVIKLDVSNSTILLFKYNDVEVEQFNIEKKQDSCYQIKSADGLKSKIEGKFVIRKNKLFFYDDKNSVTTFQYYGNTEFLNNVSYTEENISLLNKTFIGKGYDSLEKILKSTSLNCHCTHGNRRLNIVWSEDNSRQWIIEMKNDSLAISEITNPDADPDVLPTTKRVSSFKWW